MTEASAGLRKALARGAGVSKMSNEELLASLSDDQKAAIAASVAPAAKAEAMEPGQEEEEMEDGKKKPKSKEKKDDEYMDDDAKAKAATDRAVAVMSSEHAAGRTKLAADLLANDKLSAAEIVSILSASAPADAEAAARAEMQAALEANKTSEIEANDGGVSKPEAKAADVWAAAHAKVFGAHKTA